MNDFKLLEGRLSSGQCELNDGLNSHFNYILKECSEAAALISSRASEVEAALPGKHSQTEPAQV